MQMVTLAYGRRQVLSGLQKNTRNPLKTWLVFGLSVRFSALSCRPDLDRLGPTQTLIKNEGRHQNCCRLIGSACRLRRTTGRAAPAVLPERYAMLSAGGLITMFAISAEPCLAYFSENCGYKEIQMTLVPDIIGNELNLVVALTSALFALILVSSFLLQKTGGTVLWLCFYVLGSFTAGVVAQTGVVALDHFGLLDISLIYINQPTSGRQLRRLNNGISLWSGYCRGIYAATIGKRIPESLSQGPSQFCFRKAIPVENL
jgi:hypothetical protein